MIEQNFMKKLLNGVDVEWKPLGTVSDYEQPSKYLVKSKNYNDDFNTPVLTAGKTFILGYTDEINGIYAASQNPVIIFDDFTTANKWVDFDFKAKSSAMKMITSVNESEVLLKYIYYWLNTLPNQLIEGDHKRQWISNYSIKLIPIPPLHVQKEIVRILDTFTELTAELTTELTARKKQYNYYRDKLLSFEEGEVEWKALGDITKLITKGTTPRVFTDTGVNFVKIQNFSNGKIKPEKLAFISKETHGKELKRSILADSDILFAIAGATIGKCAVVEKSILPANTNQALAIIRLNECVNIRYVFNFLHTDTMKNYIAKYNKTSAQPNLNLKQISNFKIPIPPIEEQNLIVSILDNFEDLTSSIIEGLPREIELRQKQYEYYRNLLLSFPKKEVE